MSAKSSSTADGSNGRLVWNHSTHIDGLIPVLKELANYPGIKTITPGVIGRVRSRPSPLRIKISVPIRGGFKLNARKGTSVQEVFVVADCDRAELENAVAAALKKRGR